MKMEFGVIRSSKILLWMVSVILSVLLWFYVGNINIVQVEKKIPLHYRLPPDMTFFEEPLKELTVTVKGPALFIRKMDLEPTVVEVVVPIREGHDRFSFEKEVNQLTISLPLGVEKIQIVPDRILLELDRQIKKLVPVQIHKESELDRSLKMTKSRLIPSMISVDGPLSRLREIIAVKTEVLDYKNIVKSGFLDLKINSIHPTIHFSEQTTRFDYEVHESKVDVEYQKFPIRFVGKSPKQFQISSYYVKLKFLAPEKGFQKKKLREKINVTVDLSQSNNLEDWLEIEVSHPDELELISLVPEKVRVKNSFKRKKN